MYTTRELKPGDIAMANQWLGGWRKLPLPARMYPDSGLVLLNDEETPVFIGFVWKTNSGLAQLGFITRNPFVRKLPKDTRKRFLKTLMEYAQELGYEYVMTWAENRLLVDDFKEIGLRETSNRCSELTNYKES